MLTDLILGVILLLITAGLRWLYVRFQASDAVKQATEAVILAVQHVQSTYTEAIKKASEDGKLTDEEAKEAKKLAMDTALELAKGPGFELLKAYGTEKLGALVELALNKIKGSKG